MKITEEIKAIRAYAAFLSNGKEVDQQLNKLENLLRQKAQEQAMLDASQDRLKNYQDGKLFTHKKLLSGCLSEWSKKNGFNEPARLTGVANSSSFFRNLEEKRLFKEGHFGGSFHGEWSHFLQWFAIVERHNDEPFSLIHPAEIYAWLGKNQNENLWFMTFEGADDLTIDDDFRFVCELNNHSLSTSFGLRFPILHQLLKGRAVKRDDELQKVQPVNQYS